MGRGRAKAKQTKVARELKYFSPDTDLSALERELHGSTTRYEPETDAVEDDDDGYGEYGSGPPESASALRSCSLQAVRVLAEHLDRSSVDALGAADHLYGGRGSVDGGHLADTQAGMPALAACATARSAWSAGRITRNPTPWLRVRSRSVRGTRPRR